VRPLAISRDSPWSHRAWADMIAVDVPLLSDWNGDATRAFGVAMEPLGMRDVSSRASFLVEDGIAIKESWLHGGELPDVDAIIETARR
jgi:glutaredoxin-dependent peroxiredoxin